MVSVVLGATDLALGLVLTTEPAARVSGPSFTVAREWMPMQAWGVILLILASLVLIRAAIYRHAGYALSVAAGWHTVFVITLAGSAVRDPRAALTGGCIYTGMVVLHLLAAWRKIR